MSCNQLPRTHAERTLCSFPFFRCPKVFRWSKRISTCQGTKRVRCLLLLHLMQLLGEMPQPASGKKVIALEDSDLSFPLKKNPSKPTASRLCITFHLTSLRNTTLPAKFRYNLNYIHLRMRPYVETGLLKM